MLNLIFDSFSPMEISPESKIACIESRIDFRSEIRASSSMTVIDFFLCSNSELYLLKSEWHNSQLEEIDCRKDSALEAVRVL